MTNADVPELQIIELAKQNDELAWEYLLEKYRGLILSCTKGYFLPGAEHQDTVAEAYFGFFKAVRDFKPDKGVPFGGFAFLCIRRQIQIAVKLAGRVKHSFLNNSASLDTPVRSDDYEGDSRVTRVIDEAAGPEEAYIEAESIDSINRRILPLLSEAERDVFIELLEGGSYATIARSLNRPLKTVDNCIQRSRRKLQQHEGLRSVG